MGGYTAAPGAERAIGCADAESLLFAALTSSVAVGGGPGDRPTATRFLLRCTLMNSARAGSIHAAVDLPVGVCISHSLVIKVYARTRWACSSGDSSAGVFTPICSPLITSSPQKIAAKMRFNCEQRCSLRPQSMRPQSSRSFEVVLLAILHS